MTQQFKEYRSKNDHAVKIKAVQWFKNGDHPDDYAKDVEGLENGRIRVFTGAERKEKGWEGSVVRYFRRPDIPGMAICKSCGKKIHDHGWLEEEGITVCPGDFITKCNRVLPALAVTLNYHLVDESPQPAETQPFSVALGWLKEHKRIARKRWNGKNKYACVIDPGNSMFTRYGESLPMQRCLGLRNAQGEMQPGWTPSMGDLFANDWFIVE